MFFWLKYIHTYVCMYIYTYIYIDFFFSVIPVDGRDQCTYHSSRTSRKTSWNKSHNFLWLKTRFKVMIGETASQLTFSDPNQRVNISIIVIGLLSCVDVGHISRIPHLKCNLQTTSESEKYLAWLTSRHIRQTYNNNDKTKPVLFDQFYPDSDKMWSLNSWAFNLLSATLNKHVLYIK